MAETPQGPRARRRTPIFREEMLAFIHEELERARQLARASTNSGGGAEATPADSAAEEACPVTRRDGAS